MRRKYDGFNQSASEEDLAEFESKFSPIPKDVRTIYRDHDGSGELPRGGEALLPVRLMPIGEALEAQRELNSAFHDAPKAGRIVWFWTDDNSNYAGVYTDGMLEGWLVKVDH